MGRCDDCEYLKDKADERLREVERKQLVQEGEAHTTNTILERIETALTTFAKETKEDIQKNRDDINDMQVSNGILNERTNFRFDLNWKVIGIIMTFIYMIADKIIQNLM